MNFNYVLIGQPGEERFEHYYELIKKESELRPKLISYQDFLESDGNIIPNICEKTVVRLFSFWKDKNLINYFNEIGDISENNMDFEINNNSIYFPHLPKTTSGLKKFLTSIDKKISENIEKYIYVNHPLEIYMGRNKIEMSNFFQKNNVPHPRTHTNIQSIDDIFNITNKKNHKFFLKMHSGSLGKGIAIIEGNKIYSTIKIINNEFVHVTTPYETRKNSEKEKIINFLIGMDSILQEGINLAKINGSNFDYRINSVHNTIPLSEIRISEKEFTNTALGAQEIRDNEIERYLSDDQIYRAKKLAEQTANIFKSKELGFDICFDRTFKNLYVIEVNFLSGIAFPEEVRIYETDIEYNKKKIL